MPYLTMFVPKLGISYNGGVGCLTYAQYVKQSGTGLPEINIADLEYIEFEFLRPKKKIFDKFQRLCGIHERPLSPRTQTMLSADIEAEAIMYWGDNGLLIDFLPKFREEYIQFLNGIMSTGAGIAITVDYWLSEHDGDQYPDCPTYPQIVSNNEILICEKICITPWDVKEAPQLARQLHLPRFC